MKNKLSTSLLAFIMMIISLHSTAENTNDADFIFTNVNIVPMNENKVLRDKALVITNEQIVNIIDSSEVSKFKSARVIDGQNSFVIPGLADMHTHMRMKPQAMFNLLLANGVTTTTNLGLADGGGKFDHMKLKQGVAKKEMIGPRYLVSGPQLGPRLLPDVASVTKILNEHEQNGYDVIKIHQDLPFDVYDALIKEAKKRGIRITGHSQRQMALKQSLRMNSIEHAEEFLYVSKDGFGSIAADFFEFLPQFYKHSHQLKSPEYRKPMIEQFSRSGVYLDPTLSIYEMIGTWLGNASFAKHQQDPLVNYIPKKTRDYYLSESNRYRPDNFPLSKMYMDESLSTLQTIVKELHQAGVPLILGTDSFGTLVPGFSIHNELQLLVDAGLSPFEALRTGTVNVARYLNEYEKAGTIEKGKRADFVLLSANPLDDIKNTQQINGVFTHGNWLPKKRLGEMLEQAKNLNNAVERQ